NPSGVALRTEEVVENPEVAQAFDEVADLLGMWRTLALWPNSASCSCGGARGGYCHERGPSTPSPLAGRGLAWHGPRGPQRRRVSAGQTGHEPHRRVRGE